VNGEGGREANIAQLNRIEIFSASGSPSSPGKGAPVMSTSMNVKSLAVSPSVLALVATPGGNEA
jgi:hypothetical protein